MGSPISGCETRTVKINRCSLASARGPPSVLLCVYPGRTWVRSELRNGRLYRLLCVKIGRVPWDFQLTNSIRHPFLRFIPDRSPDCTNIRIQNCDTDWHLTQQYEARARKTRPVVATGMQQDEATRDESHLRKADLLTRTEASGAGSRRPQNQYW
jgi:hypothetical protein